MKSIFNGRVANVLLAMLFIAMGSSPVIAGVNCNLDKFEFHPQCVDAPPPDPDPDPGDERLTLYNVYAWWGHEASTVVGLVHDQEANGQADDSHQRCRRQSRHERSVVSDPALQSHRQRFAPGQHRFVGQMAVYLMCQFTG